MPSGTAPLIECGLSSSACDQRGLFGVQMTTSRGAHVTGVASTDKLDFVRSLGVDAVIDYRTSDYTRPAQPYDWILDVAAHHSRRRWGEGAQAGRGRPRGGRLGWLAAIAAFLAAVAESSPPTSRAASCSTGSRSTGQT
jgi:hypothetical protein